MTNRSVLAGDGIAYAGSKLEGDDQDRPHTCIEGVVYIGHLVEEVEAFEAVPCCKCVAGKEA